MKRITRYFVRYYAPGSFVANTWDVPVKSKTVKRVQWPESAYAFQLYEQGVVVDGKDEFLGAATKAGPFYFHPHSRIEGLESVKAREPGSILCRNMENNGWDEIVWLRWGNNPQPFTKGCAVWATPRHA